MKQTILFLLFATILSFFSCVDRDFDVPPFVEAEDPMIAEEDILSITDILMVRVPGDFVSLNEDKYIRGIVVADDQSGNFFRSLVIQDETAGIAIQIDEVELWNRFPIGTNLFVNIADLWIGDFNGLPQIGFEPFIDDQGRPTLGRIPAALINDIFLGGSRNNDVTPKVCDINDLQFTDLNTLVQFDDVQFNTISQSTPYADADNLSALNLTIEDCDGNTFIVRSSGFATFASENTPAGRGSITGIYGVFGSDQQLTIRDLADVSMAEPRCNEDTSGGGDPVDIDESKVITIESLFDRYIPGQEVNINTDEILKGTVISSDQSGNFFKTIVIQDGTAGIAILADQFDLFEDYGFGDEVFIVLEDLFISDFNGLPQLGYAPSTANVKRIPENQVDQIIVNSRANIVPEVTRKSINDLEALDLNTLIELTDVQFTDGSAGSPYANAATTTSINHFVEDCDNNDIILRTSGFADFADIRTPTGNGSIHAILGVFGDDLQLLLNDATDINMPNDRCDGSGGGPVTGGNDEYNLDFENLVDFDPVSIDGWTNVATVGDRVWEKRSFGGNGFAEIKAFDDPNPATEAWFISPIIDTDQRSSLSFLSATAFYEHDGLEVFYSVDYSGNVGNATWNMINVRLATESDGDFNWVESGPIDISSFGNNVTIGFRYEGTSSVNTSTYRLDDIIIE